MHKRRPVKVTLKMKFSRASRPIALLHKSLRHGDFIQRQIHTAMTHPMCLWVPGRKDRCPGWHTDRMLGPALLTQHAFRRQAVDIRRLNNRITVTTKRSLAMLISHNEQHIGAGRVQV